MPRNNPGAGRASRTRSAARIALLSAGLGGAFTASASDEDLQIKVLSNRADLISGGDVLVEIVPPTGASTAELAVAVDGRDVTGAFLLHQSGPMAGRIVGRVSDLKAGDNVLAARLSNQIGAEITITNHPTSGPVFAGPKVQPWICETEAAGFGPAQDENCNVPAKYEYFYRSTDPLKVGLQPYNPAVPPGDVATTVTDQGQVVPYIVRRETGVINRGWYSIAVLTDPGKPWEPWNRQPGWNGKIVWPFGGSSTPDHYQNAPPDVLDEDKLGRGFMVATSSLNVHGQNNNDVVSTETLMMTKERIVERYGEIRYTIGEGCSGGSILQNLAANAYPGLLDGIQPQCTYPDSRTTGNESVDCSLLLRYFDETSPHLWTVDTQRAAVSGHASSSTCVAWVDVFAFDKNADPTRGCGGTDDEPWLYHPQENPTGARCTSEDYQMAVWGPRAQDGFAHRPYANEGVQYGLAAVNSGEILPEQFVDLNEKIGGRDIDYNWIPARTAGDLEAQPIAYRTGRVTDGRQLDLVPIIDLRGSSNAEIHTDFNSYALRQRLQRNNGHADNHVIFTTDTPLIVPPSVAAEAFELMDRWLADIEADTSDDPKEVKVVRHKPAGAVDSCYIGGEKITDQAKCRAAFPYFGSTRIAAGGPLSNHYLKCELKPLDPRDYTVSFSDDQWQRLQAVFPSGVCDWNQPPVGEQPSVPWMSFENGPGGEALGPEPVSQPLQGNKTKL